MKILCNLASIDLRVLLPGLFPVVEDEERGRGLTSRLVLSVDCHVYDPLQARSSMRERELSRDIYLNSLLSSGLSRGECWSWSADVSLSKLSSSPVQLPSMFRHSELVQSAWDWEGWTPLKLFSNSLPGEIKYSFYFFTSFFLFFMAFSLSERIHSFLIPAAKHFSRRHF